MPLYEFEVLDEHDKPTGEIIEEIFKASTVPQILISNQGRKAKRKISLIARTHQSWGDTYGYYDQGLGCYVNSRKEAEKIAHKKGLAHIEDFGKYAMDDMASKKINENAFWDKQIDTCNKLVKEHGEIEGTLRWYDTKDIREEAEKWLPQVAKEATYPQNK